MLTFMNVRGNLDMRDEGSQYTGTVLLITTNSVSNRQYSPYPDAYKANDTKYGNHDCRDNPAL